MGQQLPQPFADATADSPIRILRTREAAKYCGLAESTVEKLRLSGGGPAFIRLGGRSVGYDIRDLDLWIDAHRATSTSDHGRPTGLPTPRVVAR
jgi:predicted DNA-binding transcriptional regulator AlpA